MNSLTTVDASYIPEHIPESGLYHLEIMEKEGWTVLHSGEVLDQIRFAYKEHIEYPRRFRVISVSSGRVNLIWEENTDSFVRRMT